jgi:hypothetical protein
MSNSRDIADSAATINYIDTVTSNVQDQIDNLDPLPTQTGNTGKFLTTNGTAAAWDAVDVSSEITGTLPVANGGTGSTSTTYADLTANVTGTLPVANGGTGATTLTANNVLLGNGTSAPQAVAPSTSGNVLTSDGTTWASTAPAGGGAWEFFSSTTVSSSVANIEMALSSSHDQYMIVLDNIATGNDSGGYLRWKRGGSFITTDYYYVQGQGNWTSPQNQGSFKLRNANINQNCSGIFYLNAVNDTGAGKPNYYFNGPALYELLIVGGANQIATGAVTDIQMRWDHNVTSGSVYIYTLKTS